MAISIDEDYGEDTTVLEAGGPPEAGEGETNQDGQGMKVVRGQLVSYNDSSTAVNENGVIVDMNAGNKSVFGKLMERIMGKIKFVEESVLRAGGKLSYLVPKVAGCLATADCGLERYHEFLPKEMTRFIKNKSVEMQKAIRMLYFGTLVLLCVGGQIRDRRLTTAPSFLFPFVTRLNPQERLTTADKSGPGAAAVRIRKELVDKIKEEGVGYADAGADVQEVFKWIVTKVLPIVDKEFPLATQAFNMMHDPKTGTTVSNEAWVYFTCSEYEDEWFGKYASDRLYRLGRISLRDIREGRINDRLGIQVNGTSRRDSIGGSSTEGGNASSSSGGAQEDDAPEEENALIPVDDTDLKSYGEGYQFPTHKRPHARPRMARDNEGNLVVQRELGVHYTKEKGRHRSNAEYSSKYVLWEKRVEASRGLTTGETSNSENQDDDSGSENESTGDPPCREWDKAAMKYAKSLMKKRALGNAQQEEPVAKKKKGKKAVEVTVKESDFDFLTNVMES